MSAPHQEIIESQVDVSQLAIGMHVIRLDRPWEDTDFLIQGFVIRDQSEIDSLRAQCEFVFIEGRIDGAPLPQHGNGNGRKSSGLMGFFRKKRALLGEVSQ